MDTITVKDGTQIYYKDWGTGQPLFFHHGWPLSADDWDSQMMYFLGRGYRVIAHDRRGHGRSTSAVRAVAVDGRDSRRAPARLHHQNDGLLPDALPWVWPR
jgi:non-heme chloroperoxidase